MTSKQKNYKPLVAVFLSLMMAALFSPIAFSSQNLQKPNIILIMADDLVDFTDFLPTIAQAVGVGSPEGFHPDGRSFLPQMLGKKGNPRKWIFWHYEWDDEILHFTQNKRYKLYEVVEQANVFGLETGMFFDMYSDPHEENPIPPGEGSPRAEAARAQLQTVLDNIEKHEEPWPGPVF